MAGAFILQLINMANLGTELPLIGGPFEPTGLGVIRFVFPMPLIIIGAILQSVGKYGAVGSGLKLDPKNARRDMEPWSRMKGGMVADAMDEAGIDLSRPTAEKVIMIRCRPCGQLNEEESKFCQECGKAL